MENETDPAVDAEAFTIHQSMGQEQQSNFEADKVFLNLRTALSTLQHTRRLVLGDPPYEDKAHNMDSLLAGMKQLGFKGKELCHLPACKCTKYEHLDFFFAPYSPFASPPSTFWDPAMLALSVTKSQITEITTNNAQEYKYDLLAITVLNATRTKPNQHFEQRLRQLTKLRLDIRIISPEEQVCFAGGDMAQALSSARKNPETLYITDLYSQLFIWHRLQQLGQCTSAMLISKAQ